MRAALVAAVMRLLLALLIVFCVTSAVWALVTVLPGDPVQATLGPNAAPKDVERARKLWGYDEPLADRYARYMKRLVHRGRGEAAGVPNTEHASCAEIGLGLHVDLGVSLVYRKPVVELVKKKLSATIDLALAAILLQILFGSALGVAAGVRRGSRTDAVVMAAATALSAAPTFIVGLALQFFFAHRLGWLPLDGQGTGAVDKTRALVLPALTLGLYGTAVIARSVRAELADALDERYVLAARAKGASRARATLLHAMRNAIAPIAQLVVLELGALIGGAIVTERLFRWPGIGELSVVAIQNRDAPALVGVTLIGTIAMVLATMLADVVAIILDPRRRKAA